MLGRFKYVLYFGIVLFVLFYALYGLRHVLENIEARQIVFEVIGPCEESLYFRRHITENLLEIRNALVEKNISAENWIAMESKLKSIQIFLDHGLTDWNQKKKDADNYQSHQITVLINAVGYSTNEISKILESDSELNTIIAVSNKVDISRKNIQTVSVSHPSEAWYKLLSLVTTPYVFIGRNVIVIPKSIPFQYTSDVVGVSVLNDQNKWTYKCYKSSMRNYALYYSQVYKLSRDNCFTCDHIDGPFITKSSLFLTYPLMSSTNDDIVFSDWFLQIKEAGVKTMLCADITVNVLSTTSVEIPRNIWIPVAFKWKLTSISHQSSKYTFTCKESVISCHPKKVAREFLLAPCCRKQVASALSVLDAFCQSRGISYEIDSGLVIGVVKMEDFTPWDLDGDVSFYTKDYDTFKNNSQYFISRSLILSEFEDPSNKTSGYFDIYTPELYIEMFGSKINLTNIFLPSDTTMPSRVKFKDHWILGTVNPGAYARNRYGLNCLRHSQSWIVFGGSSSFAIYVPGRWHSCSIPSHHSCLDNYPTDGSLEFQNQPFVF